MSRRIVIIGAGPGGLAAAMILSAAGADVTVLERQERVGGRSATIGADGFRFDLGPTFFLYPRVLEDVFATCGDDLHRCVELIRLDPQYRLMFEGGQSLDASPDPARMRAEIARIAPGDAAGFDRFMTENRAKIAAFRPVLESAFCNLRDYLSPSLLRALSLLRPHRSVDSDLKRYFDDPLVRLAFSFQSKYLGMSPFRCPSLFSILSFLEYEYGVFHPRGGTGAVMEAMAAAAVRAGADIRLSEPVQEILFDGRRATGVRTEAGIHQADAVVINADFAQAMTRLVPNDLRRRWSDRRIESKRYSCSTFMMYLGIEGTVPDLAHHTIHLAADYRRNIQEIEEGRTLPRRPSFYVQNACVTDPGQAPPGHSTLYVLVPVGHLRGHVDWRAEQAHYRERILDHLSAIGVPDLRRRIRYERIMTPQLWESDMAVYKGATFNLAHSLDQMMYLRPRNRFEDLDGVYLVGGGTHPGSGLPVIFESARITTRLMADDLGFRLPAAAARASFPTTRELARQAS